MPAMVCPHGEAPYECRECVHRYCNADLASLRAETARLRAALRKYGFHYFPCRKNPHQPTEEIGPCTCGLDNALRSSGEETDHDR